MATYISGQPALGRKERQATLKNEASNTHNS